MKNCIKVILAVLIFVGGIIAAIYFGLWIMFIKSILIACAAFDAGTLTATLVGWTVIKCLLASCVASIIMSVALIAARFLLD